MSSRNALTWQKNLSWTPGPVGRWSCFTGGSLKLVCGATFDRWKAQSQLGPEVHTSRPRTIELFWTTCSPRANFVAIRPEAEYFIAVKSPCERLLPGQAYTFRLPKTTGSTSTSTISRLQIGATADGTCLYDRLRSMAHVRREIFPLVMRTYRPDSQESKNARRARLDLYDAQRAWCEAVQAYRTEEAIEAGVRLAGLLAAEKESSRKRAQRLYQEAIDSGHQDFAPAAAFGLGILLEETNDLSGAQEAYEQALEYGHPEFAPWAAFHLGSLFERLEQLDRAQVAYERAMRLKHPEITSWAALKLGDLAVRQRDHEKALEIYQLLIALRHPELASLGSLAAARLLSYLGKRDRAMAAYKQAISMGPPDTARIADKELRDMFQEPVHLKRTTET